MILFAHRGAPRTPAEQNTLPAFQRALTLGADGLESDVALTADGVPVLVHPRRWSRGPRIADLSRTLLPAHVPALADLYWACGSRFELSLDMGEPAAVEAVVELAAGQGALDRLWLTYWRLPRMLDWRRRWPEIKLVYATMPLAPRRLDRTLAALAGGGIDAINLLHWLCTARLVEHARAHSLRIFAWGIRGPRALARVQACGADGAFCDGIWDEQRPAPGIQPAGRGG
jgi:glycerophosphoryl diester phosphodiesterase